MGGARLTAFHRPPRTPRPRRSGNPRSSQPPQRSHRRRRRGVGQERRGGVVAEEHHGVGVRGAARSASRTTSGLPVNTASSKDTGHVGETGRLDDGVPGLTGAHGGGDDRVVGRASTLAQVRAGVPRAGQPRSVSVRAWSLGAKGSAFACRITIRRRRSVTGQLWHPVGCAACRTVQMPAKPTSTDRILPRARTAHRDRRCRGQARPPDRAQDVRLPRRWRATPRSPWSRPRARWGPRSSRCTTRCSASSAPPTSSPHGRRAARRPRTPTSSACSTTSPASS